MKKMRKGLAIIIAMITMLAVTVLPVSADPITFPYLTLAGSTQYTNIISTSYSNLDVQKLGSDWNTYPFSDLTDVGKVVWSWPNGGDNNFTTDETEVSTTGGYFARLRVKAKATADSGAYTVRATYDNDAYIDLTLVVMNSTSETATVKVSIDSSDYSGFNAVNTNVLATASNYNYATPLKALDAMIGTSYSGGTKISAYTQSSGYVNSITGFLADNSTVTNTASYTTGWQYRVYHYNNNSYSIDNSTELIDASAYKLTTGDYIKWYYGTYDEATTYFATHTP